VSIQEVGYIRGALELGMKVVHRETRARLKLIHNVLRQHNVISFCHTFESHSCFVGSKRILRSQRFVYIFKDGVKWDCWLFCESPYEQLAHLAAEELIPKLESESAAMEFWGMLTVVGRWRGHSNRRPATHRGPSIHPGSGLDLGLGWPCTGHLHRELWLVTLSPYSFE
jgi:hypothetical protein